MKLLVGCPLVGNPKADRNWILKQWFEHLSDSCRLADVDLNLVFLINKDDKETVDLVSTFPNVHIFYTDLVGGAANHRWNKARYHQMVAFRNELLKQVRKLDPEFFFSLDSDVLLHVNAIPSLLSAMDEKEDAWTIGAKCFVSKHGTMHPNAGHWTRTGNGYFRKDVSTLTKVDILICCYLMRKNAYSIDYEFDPRGEDLGWSLAVSKAGGSLYWDGRVINKHVMDRGLANQIDKRVGF